MIKRTFLLFLIPSVCLTVFSFVQADKKPAGRKQPVLKTIIVDAGHGIRENGGHDGAKADGARA